MNTEATDAANNAGTIVTAADQTPSGRTSARKGLAFGLTAGLVGGAAAGMVLGMPGLSSAASPAAPAAAVAVVAQVDDAGTDAARPEPGTRVREALQELVDDGTLSAEQADAVAAHLVENRPERADRGDRGGRGRFGGEVSEAVTDLLGIDAATLRAELREGSTLAEIAAANGVETQTLVDTLVAEAEARLAAAVEAGKVDADRAAEIGAEIEERVTARINGEGPVRRGPGGQRPAGTEIAD